MINHAINHRRSAKSGVTILEVLVVLTIIALIAAVVAPRLMGYLDRAKSETAALQIDQLGNAVQLFYIDVGRYPSEGEGLGVLYQSPPGESAWQGPYLPSEDALTDPWGRPYLYTPPESGSVFGIETFGKDGSRGGSGEDSDLAF